MVEDPKCGVEIPSSFKSICWHKPKEESTQLITKEVPEVPKGHILVRIEAAPINPSDEYFSKGSFGSSSVGPWITCGFEGAGVIVAVGEDVDPGKVNMKAAVNLGGEASELCLGTWSEYSILPDRYVYPFPNSIECADACALFINPLTVAGMIEHVQMHKSPAFINTAACSALGKVLISAAKKAGLQIICLVRKEEQIERLREIGAGYVLNTSKEYKEELKELTAKLSATVAFDAISGPMPNELAECMPPNSIIYVYGMLSTGEKVEIQRKDVQRKSYYIGMGSFMKDQALKTKVVQGFIDDLEIGGNTYRTTVAKKYKLEEFKEALVEYRVLASTGKCIFTPHS